MNLYFMLTYSILVNNCKGTCNNINDPYPKLCVSDVAKNINVELFNLKSRTNEARRIKCYKTYKCKCRLYACVCNNKKRWNNE